MKLSDIVGADSRFTIRACDNPEEWNAFVESNDGPVYALWEWGEVVSSYGHDHWNLLARKSSSGEIVGALPLTLVQGRIFGSKLLSPAFAVRGSVVLDSTDPDSVRWLLLRKAKQMADDLDVDVVSLRGAGRSSAEGFVRKNRYVTFHVPLERDEDVIWSRIDGQRRRYIAKAATDASLRYDVADSIADLREFYRLYHEMMRDLGNPHHSFEFFRTLWDRLSDRGVVSLRTLHRDDSLVNARIDLLFGSTVYQYCVVTDAEHRDLHGGSLLMWKAIQWASRNGYETFDLSRTRDGSPAYTFKQSFGGTEVWYDDLHYFPDGKFEPSDPADGKYMRARALWRHLPLVVSRRLGPMVRKRIGL